MIKEHLIVDKKKDEDIFTLSEQIKITEAQSKECHASIKKIDKSGLWSSEQAVLTRLKEEGSTIDKKILSLRTQLLIRERFQPISLDFLSRSQTVSVPVNNDADADKIKLSVPLFSAHKIDGKRIEVMGIRIQSSKDSKRVVVDIGNSTPYGSSPTEDALHGCLSWGFLHALKMADAEKLNTTYSGRRFILTFSPSCYKSLHMDKLEGVRLRSKFLGLIPDTVKTAIKEAAKIKADLYLIKQADWKVSPVTNDPLVVVISPDEKAYFVTSFDCTPVEYWARQEYTTD